MSDPEVVAESGGTRLFVVASIGGFLTGLVASTFGLALEHGGELRSDLVGWAHGESLLGFLVLLLVTISTTVTAAYLVHRIEPHAEGSGIPRVEAVVEGRAEAGRLRILPVKYLGGLLAIGGGLALGREGPSVQMGGVIAAQCARVARLSGDEFRMVIAGGAAAVLPRRSTHPSRAVSSFSKNCSSVSTTDPRSPPWPRPGQASLLRTLSGPIKPCSPPRACRLPSWTRPRWSWR